MLTAGIDVQKDRFAILITGHGRAGQQWVIDYNELPADPTTDAAWAALDAIITQPLVNSRGMPMKISLAAIDSGYLTDYVLSYTRLRRGRIIAVKGASSPGKPIINRPSKLDVTIKGRTIKHGAEGWLVGADTAKHTLFAILTADGSFYNQLTAEVWDPDRRRWVKVRPRNEALDTWCYALAAAHHPSLRVHLWKEPQWARLEAALEPATGDLFASAMDAAVNSAKPEETTRPTIRRLGRVGAFNH